MSGHVSEVRLEKCSSRKDGTGTDFYASVYFQLGGQWYYLQLIGANRIPPPPPNDDASYTGPGLYRALLDFREVLALPGRIIIGEHAWGPGWEPADVPALTVAPAEEMVKIGSFPWADRYRYQPTLSDEVQLWPKRPDQSGPPQFPAPTPDQVIRLRGSWNCDRPA